MIVLEATQRGWVQRALSTSFLVRAGDISYAFYLIHLAIIWSYAKVELRSTALLTLSHNAPWISLFLALVLTALVTWLGAEALTRIEAPFMRMRHALRRDHSTIRNSATPAVRGIPTTS
jgi:peptidoglycan/LPS O-acetylase OafA/YrhL